MYYDSELIGEYTTDSNGLTEAITISDLSEGIHKLSARFNGYSVGGDDYLVATSTSKDISVGYIVTILEYPQYVINNKPSTVKVKVTNQFNTPMEGNIVYIMENGSPVSSYKLSMGGIATITDAGLSNNPFYARAGSDNTQWYNSSDYYTHSYTNAVVTFTQPNLITSTNNQLPIQGQVQNVSEPVTVDVTDVGIINTSANGSFSTFYEGKGMGDVSISASIYGSSATIQIEDVYQYWKSPNKSMNYNFRERYGSITAVSNGWKCSPSTQTSIRFLGNFVQNDIGSHFCVEFKLVSAPSTMGVGVGIDYYIIHYPKKGDVIRIETNKNNNTTLLFINNELGHTYDDFASSTGAIEFLLANSTQSVIIDEVKLKRL